MSDKVEGSAGDSLMKVENLKAGKRKLKAPITSQVNELAGRIAGGEIKSREEMEEIKLFRSVWKNLGKNMEILREFNGRSAATAREKP